MSEYHQIEQPTFFNNYEMKQNNMHEENHSGHNDKGVCSCIYLLEKTKFFL
jgi:hypothetical protein